MGGQALLGLPVTRSPPGQQAQFKLEAPLAVQSRQARAGFFPFNKFSALPLLMHAARLAQAESGGDDTKKRLMVVPNCHILQFVTEDVSDPGSPLTKLQALDQIASNQDDEADDPGQDSRDAPARHGRVDVGRKLQLHRGTGGVFLPAEKFEQQLCAGEDEERHRAAPSARTSAWKEWPSSWATTPYGPRLMRVAGVQKAPILLSMLPPKAVPPLPLMTKKRNLYLVA